MTSPFKKLFGKGGTEYVEKNTTQPIAESKLILEDLSDNEKKFVTDNIGLATELFKELGIINNNHIFDPSNIEIGIETWFSQDLQAKYRLDQNMYSDALACGWGKYLSEILGMDWHVITDNYGTEIGVYHKNNNVTIFPFNSMSKAFRDKKFDLISIITSKAKDISTTK